MFLFPVFGGVLMVWAAIPAAKIYTTADGLLRDAASCVEQDSRGFIWFCANGGLTRFDGYEFTSYTTDDGLPHSGVSDFLEARDGTIWVATSGGFVRFNPRGKRAAAANQSSETAMFVTFKPSEKREEFAFKKLVEDKNGVIWGGTFDGTFRITLENGVPNFEKFDTGRVEDMRFDQHGVLWITTLRNGVFRIFPDKRTENFTKNLPKELAAIFEDRNGRIWLGSRRDKNGYLCELYPEFVEQNNIVKKCYGEKDNFSEMWIFAFLERRNGEIWLASSASTIKMELPADSTPKLTSLDIGKENCGEISSAFEDRDQNLWFSTPCGIFRIPPNGFMQYGAADGLENPGTSTLFETLNGELITESFFKSRIFGRFNGEKFEIIRPNYLPNIKVFGWGTKHTTIQTRDGDWWIPLGNNSLYRYSGIKDIKELSQKSPTKIYGRADGLDGDVISLLYEDRHGNIWIQTLFPFRLYRMERESGKFFDLSGALAMEKEQEFSSFAEDNTGNLWLGTSGQFNLVRYRNGVFERFSAADGVPEGRIFDIFTDSRGRLWLASGRSGAILIAEPNADAPNFQVFNTRTGLSDNQVMTIVEDNFGQIYIAHGRGVDRLDTQTGRIKRFTKVDGLPQNEINQSLKDKNGAIWFGSGVGLVRLIPEPEKPRLPPNIFIKNLRVAGEIQTVSELGETILPNAEFVAAQNNLTIEFIGLGATLGEEMRYLYKIGNETDWTETKERSLNFANLTAGNYRFQVKAVTAEGIESVAPATFEFVILSPIYLRWWFLLGAFLAVGFIGYAIYKYRVNRLLQVERTRTQIAADLHDDIGSNLSKISLMSELARLRIDAENEENQRLLASVAEIARDSVGSMRDIIWAINPRRDSVLEVSRKMRSHAEETLVPLGIEVKFDAPQDEINLKFAPELRRELYLIFKESVNNCAKHADASRVEIEFSVKKNDIFFRITDNGKGFNPNAEFDGEGINGIKRRAAKIGGNLNIESAEGGGTKIFLKLSKKKFEPTEKGSYFKIVVLVICLKLVC